jgi:hypothetical protein
MPRDGNTIAAKLQPSCSRRTLLRFGTLGLAGASLPCWLAAEEASRRSGIEPRADACIVVFLNGGPSHLDMWDMKPNAPAEIRGEFGSIASSLVGLAVSEHLPRLSRIMHHATLVRSMHHSVNNSHAAAVYSALTGHDRGEQGGGAKPTDNPPPGAVISKVHAAKSHALPYVALPYKTQEGAGGPLQPGFLAGFIGPNFDPFWVDRDPNAADFRVPNLSLVDDLGDTRMARRRELLKQLDRRIARTRNETNLIAIDQFRERAFDLLTSDQAQRAFRVDLEPAKVRESYGRNIYGQSLLLARRLIEAGTRFVTMSWAPDANATWDTHGNNFQKLKQTLLPQFDAACTSLVSDLLDRGMLDRTLVAVMGDFGRTPRVNNAAGRDHWNSCYSLVLLGGGTQRGCVFGASDRFGATPIENPVTPGDIIATMYHLFGIDHRSVLFDSLDRPHTIVPEGRVIRQLLA